MPIRIREIHIKATVSDENDRPSSRCDSDRSMDTAQNPETIIAICVEQVLRRLKAQEER